MKRKRYVESVDISFSGDDDEDGDFPQRSSKKPERIVELNVSRFFFNRKLTIFNDM